MKVSRRKFIKLSGASAIAFYIQSVSGRWVKVAEAAIPGGSLTPGDVAKYAEELVKPPAMPPFKLNRNQDFYRIGVREFKQQILPSDRPETTVWSYGAIDFPGTVLEGGTFNYPAFTIEANWSKRVLVNWRNELIDANGNFLPHLLPVDPTLHWANPAGGAAGRDGRPQHTDGIDEFSDPYYNAEPGTLGYTGPVPIVTHVHGAHTHEDSDGYPEAWYLPAANNIPGNYARTGTFFEYFNAKYNHGWEYGDASFVYPNDQRATTLWYHDHTLGMTRLNVYAGPAGFWLIRGGPDDTVVDNRDDSTAILPGPAPGVGDDPFGEYGEIPIVFQDRSFNDDGSLFYPDHRAFFEGLQPEDFVEDFPFTPETACDEQMSDVAPIWQPEFFGNMMVVNGRTWPYLNVEQRRYRFRLLNGCNSRFLILDFGDMLGVEVWQIGAEGGFLAEPVNITADHDNRILMAPAERADVIVDFTNVPEGNYILKNLGPDEPFGGGTPGDDFDPAAPDSTGQVMEFRVGPMPEGSEDNSTPPQYLQLPVIAALTGVSNTRYVSLNEEESHSVRVLVEDEGEEEVWITPVELACDNEDAVGFGPTAALLGTINADGSDPSPLLWSDLITENPAVGAVEEWEIHNHTADAHPIHIHLVQFQVIDREVASEESPNYDDNIGQTRPPEAWENGWKDTVISYPGEITRVRMRFDIAGLYVWHCHIVEHEDNEMMRPYHVGPIPPDSPQQ